MNNIDALDRQILRVLTKDARTPYAEMAKNFGGAKKSETIAAK